MIKVKLRIEKFLKKLEKRTGKKIFSVKDLELFIEKKIIQNLDEEDLKTLEAIAKIWKKPVFIKRQLAHFSRREREKLIETSGLSKMESYIYTRIKNIWEKGEKINVNQLISEVIRFFQLEDNEYTRFFLKKRIKSIRNRVRKNFKFKS